MSSSASHDGRRRFCRRGRRAGAVFTHIGAMPRRVMGVIVVAAEKGLASRPAWPRNNGRSLHEPSRYQRAAAGEDARIGSRNG